MIAQAEQRKACCSSPAAICHWFAVSLASWGALGFAGTYWRHLRASSAVTILFAIGIGCVANWFRNRTFRVIGARLLLSKSLHGPHQARPGLVSSSDWNRHRVPVGIAVCDSILLRFETRAQLESRQRWAEESDANVLPDFAYRKPQSSVPTLQLSGDSQPDPRSMSSLV